MQTDITTSPASVLEVNTVWPGCSFCRVVGAMSAEYSPYIFKLVLREVVWSRRCWPRKIESKSAVVAGVTDQHAAIVSSLGHWPPRCHPACLCVVDAWICQHGPYVMQGEESCRCTTEAKATIRLMNPALTGLTLQHCQVSVSQPAAWTQRDVYL